MLFSSIFFLFYFLPIVLVLNYFLPQKYSNVMLLVASLIFYSWGEPVYVFLMIFSAVFNYSMALDIAKFKVHGRKKKCKNTLIFTVIINLFILGYFKYYGFLIDTINLIFGLSIKYTALPLPIGISFYTFQAMSYVIDIYRGDAKVQRSLVKFSLYLSLFPQLIAGPIVKYKDIAVQLDNRQVNIENTGKGTVRFILGLGKKVILANSLGSLHTYIIAMGETSSVLATWLGAIAFTLQIYFDFSGYSDMAIGLGKMLGFDFMENFNYPYISKSVTEFWRRWHISLSTWFKEYVYIPLGGNRVTKSRHILNLIIVWSLTGLWHGASWNFVLWGLNYGLILILEKYVLDKYMDKWPNFARHLYVLAITVFSFVLFSSEDVTLLTTTLKNMVGLGGVPFANSQFLYLLKENLILLVGSIMFAGPCVYQVFSEISKKRSVFFIVILMGIFVISVSYLIFNSYNPFLYFRF